jgi:hypothetical protein
LKRLKRRRNLTASIFIADVGTALLLDVGIVGLLNLVTCLYR